MKSLSIAILIIVVAFVMGCEQGADSPRGFSLSEGNVENGKLIFLKYQCLSCHQLPDVEPPVELVKNSEISVKLGGRLTQVKTYADLLTSVINPSHKLARGYRLDTIQKNGESKMRNYNDVMTVTELVDLVTFLQSNYELVPYQKSNYQYYRQ